ncbi:MAG TPA: TIGR03067 domain-containing protein [Candidatus Didemnitutus sp.]|nr:TIGR03067 domain-containing protein [Candidatus Didemnitutus sp.]
MQSPEGRWQPLYAELDTEEAPKEVLEQTELELSAGKYDVRFGGITADRGTFVLNTTGGHAELTLHGNTGPNAGRTIPCIFKFIDDTLMICYGLDGARPDKFSTTAGSQRYLVTYARK